MLLLHTNAGALIGAEHHDMMYTLNMSNMLNMLNM
jgi:hypothetical protein